MLQPAVDEFWELAVTGEDMEVSKVKARQLPGIIGKTLMQLELPAKTGLMVVAVVHADGERAFNPPPTFAPDKEDELIVIGPTGGVEKMMALLGQDSG